MNFNTGRNVPCPCKGCEERHCACSDSCSKFKEYRAEIEKRKQYTKDNKYRFASPHNRPYMKLGKCEREHKKYDKNIANGYLY